MDVYIDLSQFKVFQNKIQRLSEEFKNQAIKEITQVASQNILQQTQANTPVDTGTLRRGWKTEINDIPNGYQIEISNDVEYAPYVEYGHRTRGGKSFVEGRYMLTNAMRDTENNFGQLAENTIDNFFNSRGL